MKKSEETNVPLSSRAGANNAISKAQSATANFDITVSKNKYGVSMKKGNFRRTQEDRVSYKNILNQNLFLFHLQFLAYDSLDGSAQNATFGVFDGHSGDKAAQYCSENIIKRLVQNKQLERDIC